MRTLIVVFCFFLLAVEISFPVGAVTTPQIDEIEIMMAKIKSNLQMASQVTQMAQAKSAALVAQKQEEKAELKEAVVSRIDVGVAAREHPRCHVGIDPE